MVPGLLRAVRSQGNIGSYKEQGMMADDLRVLYAWVKDSNAFHFAAGQGLRTACAIPIGPEWSVGDIVDMPANRRPCKRCESAQGDAARSRR